VLVYKGFIGTLVGVHVGAGICSGLLSFAWSFSKLTLIAAAVIWQRVVSVATLTGRPPLALPCRRDQIGIVQQEPVLFSGNISDNIRMGKPGATQAEIEEAAKMSNAHSFIMNFPGGYDTEVR
jgi:ABC-type transport system involved in cytochrome bd biosynthesis fused ATPase/permease subunit